MNKIGEHILDIIHQKTGRDDALREFLQELIYVEAENIGKYWHFKDKYKKLIEKYCYKWENYED
ncbi:MAG: hypothetical protein ACFFG0_19625 [Candidatus Thorarchaeota archaeon]